MQNQIKRDFGKKDFGMNKYEFTSKESGQPCSDKYNTEVSEMFSDNPVLEEIFLTCPDLLIYLADKLANEEIVDWNSRLEVAAALEKCEDPVYKEQAKRVAANLRNMSMKA